ncbi:MAG: carbohydrate ABC transporter permease, partial [Eubacteriales bacterium]|nr:carbohydrate ABC transporter permease [Eubacteriales bacterium]
TPILAVLVLFYAVGHWNNYFNAMIYLSDARWYPLQIYLRNILIMEDMAELAGDEEAIQAWLQRLELKESMKFGVVIVASVPVLALYPFLQKYFVKGMMVGAIKS